MTSEELLLVPKSGMLGCLRIFKPAKNARIGIPVQGWHHLAILDDIVLRYVWDTREIDGVFKLSDITRLDTVAMLDSGKQLIPANDAAKQAAQALIDKYGEACIPIIAGNAKRLVLADARAQASASSLELAHLPADVECTDDARVLFLPKSYELPESMHMYEEASTLSPDKRKFVDTYNYTSLAKQFAILARLSIIRNIVTMNSHD